MAGETPASPKVLWTLQGTAALILVVAGSGKLLGGATDIFIFEQLGQEPLGRWGAGIVEIGAALLLLIPRLSVWGGLGAVGTMIGAAGAHATVLGWDVNGDGGLHVALFAVGLGLLRSGTGTSQARTASDQLISSIRLRRLDRLNSCGQTGAQRVD